jgi:hypothetical protein
MDCQSDRHPEIARGKGMRTQREVEMGASGSANLSGPAVMLPREWNSVTAVEASGLGRGVRMVKGPVANFFQPVCERRKKAVRPNFWLWIGLPGARIPVYSCIDTGLAERNSYKIVRKKLRDRPGDNALNRCTSK